MLALVTGSTGFLGRHLVERLLASGWHVRALARDPTKARVFAHTSAEVALGDVTSPDSLTPAMAGVDVVFHAAALVSNWGPWPEFLATTVGGTENLLHAASDAQVKLFIHVSTIRVYDDRYCRKAGVVTEDAPQGSQGFRPFGHYARAKVMAEAAVRDASTQLPVSIIRPAWIYGPGDRTILPGIVRFLRGRGASWPGRCDACADPIYVTDAADCAIAAATHPAAIGQAYNAAPRQRIGVREFLGTFCDALGLKTPRRSIPYFVAESAAEVSEWCAHLIRSRVAPPINRAGLAILTEDVHHDPAKAERELEWRSKVDLTEGVAATVAWLKNCFPEITG